MAAPTAATTVVAAGLAVAINYATGDGSTRWWLWGVVVVLVVASFVAALWLDRQQGTPTPPTGEQRPGVGSRDHTTTQTSRIRGSGNITVQAGRDAHVSPPQATPPSTPS